MTFEDLTEQQKESLKGKQGPQGPKGDPGSAGKDGYTPVKGVDYFTEADKAEMVQSVLAALPNAEGVGF